MADTSPPAFPSIERALVNGFASEVAHPGMSLRDYFAIHATADDIKHHSRVWSAEHHTHIDVTAPVARYRFADAMLAARDQH
jgi:hypothetical protein